MKKSSSPIISNFGFKPGRVFLKKYEILELLGTGWEGEVYKISELSTGIERAAKFFYPHRNLNGKAASHYAKKLHRIRHCPIIIQYHTQEFISVKGQSITVLISEYVQGEILANFLHRQRGKRLPEFQALHFLYALVNGLEQIHLAGEYHGDLHEENIIISRFGLGFEIKLLDFFQRSDSKRINMFEDLVDAIHIFHTALGGRKIYSRHSNTIKHICSGLKRSLIAKKFKNTSALREHLENLSWD